MKFCKDLDLAKGPLQADGGLDDDWIGRCAQEVLDPSLQMCYPCCSCCSNRENRLYQRCPVTVLHVRSLVDANQSVVEYELVEVAIPSVSRNDRSTMTA